MSINIGSRVSVPSHPQSEPAYGRVVDIRREHNRSRAQQDRYVIQPDGTEGEDYRMDFVREQLREMQ